MPATQAGARVIETDAVVVGAGPAGLFQVFQLGLLEIKAHVIDSLTHVGGQCIELYPDKPIYDIPAIPVCSGRELVARLEQQIQPFDAVFHLGQELTAVRPQSDGRFLLETTDGQKFMTRTLFIAGGAGSFRPRQLKVAGAESYRGTQLFYTGHFDSDETTAARKVVIVGGDESALNFVLHLLDDSRPPHGRPASVTLLHRRDVLQADPATLARIDFLRHGKRLSFVAAQIVGIRETNGRMNGIQILDTHAQERCIDLDSLFVFLGLSPRLGPIAEWGLQLEGRQITVNPETFESGTPGIFAIGDIAAYPGKKKLILSAFHEAALAAFGAAARLFPEKHIPLQYTTTSTKLHRLLKVS